MGVRGRVLVVDDDRLNRSMLSKLLEKDGYEVSTASDGGQALAALGESAFDLVLLDLVMPEVDGIEVLQTMKRSSRWWHIPVIMVSAVEETQSIVRCIELGAEDYVLKPFDPVLLAARVNASLARKRFHDLELEYHGIVKEQAAELAELNRRLAGRGRDEPAAGSGPPLPPHRGTVAVLACGLDGVGAFAARSDPEDALAVVDEFQAAVDRLAVRFGATVASSTADAVTLVFNDPLPSPDAVPRAARLAVMLTDELRRLIAHWGERPGCNLGWGAAICLGDAALGRVGGDDRWQYAAVGPVVDRAARLRDRARPHGTVLVDQDAGAALDGLVELEWVDGASSRLVALRPDPAGPAGPVGTVEAGA
jgi:CheY-like chemotaxis protein